MQNREPREAAQKAAGKMKKEVAIWNQHEKLRKGAKKVRKATGTGSYKGKFCKKAATKGKSTYETKKGRRFYVYKGKDGKMHRKYCSEDKPKRRSKAQIDADRWPEAARKKDMADAVGRIRSTAWNEAVANIRQ